MGAWRAAALAAEFGFSVVGSMVGGIVVGQFVDQWLGTAPAFFLVGLFCGLVFSIYLIYVIYRLQISSPRRAAARPAARATDGDDSSG